MIPISWIVFQKLLQDTLVNIRSKILGKIDLKNAITLCRLTSVIHTSYSSVYVSFSSDKVNSFINTSFSARWLFLYQKDSNVPQISTGFLCGYLAHRQYTAPPPPPSNFSAAFFDKMCGTCHDICSVLLHFFAELVVTFLYSAFLTKSNGGVFKPLQFLHPVRRHVSHGFLILPAKFEVTHFCDKT